ncbi:flavodoxin family protein [Limosilactobacillus fermentum]|uniref:flavodoxin family protein n=2 Tax=Limosilactobacillus fermentum TaxID=1613 RepID=UPI001023616D|nr:flavodoxin family protein [Limosilactobacillus fermentum]QBE60598.1 flavodoxin family protein [Limosilactobacillus fermentum]
MEKKILIATYSWSGHTKRLADQIAKLLSGADQYQIAVPVKQFLNQLTNFAGHLAPFYTDAGVANTLPKDAGAASGLINTMHQIGSSVGLALIVGVTGRMTHGVASYRQSLLMSTICAAIALAIIVFVVIPGEQRENQLKLKH